MMQRFRKFFVTVVSLATLAAIGTFMDPGRGKAAEGSAPVTVVNTPLSTTGTATVSGTVNIGSMPPITGSVGISNTPTITVGALPPVTGNVGISNTPTVNVGSLPAVTGSVGITNSPSVYVANSVNNPVQVQDTAGAGSPFSLWQAVTISNGASQAAGSFPETNLQKLRIEYESADCLNVPGGIAIQLQFLTSWNGDSIPTFSPPVAVPAGLNNAFSGRQVNLYSDGTVGNITQDAKVHFTIYRNYTAGDLTCFVSINGRQVNF